VTPFPETFSTEYWAALSGAEWHGGLFSALRTHRVGLDFSADRPRGGRRKDGNPFRLAALATFRFVAELFVVEEKLFAGGENEVSAAVNALQRPVLKFHCELLCPAHHGESIRQARRVRASRPLEYSYNPWVRPDRTGKCAGYFKSPRTMMSAQLISAG